MDHWVIHIPSGPLHVETGRYSGTPLDQRLCNVCNGGQIEDEFHFLCICINYQELRERLYQEIIKRNDMFITYENEEKFKEILKYHQFPLMKYLKSAWEARKVILFNSSV